MPAHHVPSGLVLGWVLAVVCGGGCYRSTGYCDSQADCPGDQVCSAYRCVLQTPSDQDQGPGPESMDLWQPEDAVSRKGFLWSRVFGGSTLNKGLGVAADGRGNVAVTGYFGGTADFGGGNRTSAGMSDVFVVKYDLDGKHLFSKVMGGKSANAFGSAVAIDGEGGVVTTGTFNLPVDFGGGVVNNLGPLDGFVVKHGGGPVGLKWFKDLGATGALVEGKGVAVNSARDVVVVGEFVGKINLGGADLVSAGAGMRDIFIVKYAGTNGQHLFSQRYGGPGADTVGGVIVDGNGDLIVAGSFTGTADFGGPPLQSAGGADIYLAAYHGMDGKPMWSRGFGGPGNDRALGVALGPDGGVAVTGSFQGMINFGGPDLVCAGDTDGYVARLSPGGVYQWSRRFGARGSTLSNAVAISRDGDVVVTGSFDRKVDFGGGADTAVGTTDLFWARYAAADGGYLSSKTYGSPLGGDAGYGIAIDRGSEATLTGVIQGSIDFGDGPQNSAGSSAIFVFRFGL